MRQFKISSLVFVCLLIPLTAFGYGEECLEFGSPERTKLSENTVYAEISWKVDVSNV